jgi:protein-S-isoprenylcysteine O-methyltransferase Ste14
MTTENAARLVLAVVFVLTAGTAVWHRLRAARSGERVSRQDEGLWMRLTLRPAGLLLGLSVLAYLVEPGWMAWAALDLPAWLRWAGAALGLVAAFFVHWTLEALGENLTDTVAVRAGHTLVTNGPFRWVRHPYYLGFLLLVVATFLLSRNWFIGIVGLVVFVLLAVRTPAEERKLVERFGDEYRQYTARTGRFLPRFSRRR